MKLAEERVEMLGLAPGDVEITASHRPGDDEGSGFNAVWDDAVLGAFEFADSFHSNGGSSGTFDPCSHFVEQVGEVFDLRLAGAVLEDCLAVGESCCHEQI